jgi:hypothetical protein
MATKMAITTVTSVPPITRVVSMETYTVQTMMAIVMKVAVTAAMAEAVVVGSGEGAFSWPGRRHGR